MGAMTLGLGLGLQQAFPPFAAAPLWQERGIVASRLSAPYSAVGNHANAAGKTEIYEQSSVFMAVDASALSVLYQHVRNGGVGIGSFTVKARLQKGSIWSGLTSDDPILSWGGAARSGPIAPGDVLESDISSFSAAQGERIVCRRHLIYVEAPANFPGAQINIYEGDEVNQIGDGLTDRIASNDWAGGWYSRDGGETYVYAAPSLILGLGATRKARLCIVNDSIGMGSGDNGALPLIGWPARLLGDDWPWYLVGNEGYQLTALMADPADRARRLGLLQRAGITHLLVQAGSNDLGAGRSTAQVLADLEALQAELELLPLQPRVVPATMAPRTNAGNTAEAGVDAVGVWAERLSCNQAIRDANGLGFGYLDAALYSQAAGNPNLWDSTAGKGSADGIHPNAATHAAIAAGLSADLESLLDVAHYV